VSNPIPVPGEHECLFPEITVGDELVHLGVKPGTHVLNDCACGEGVVDAFEMSDIYLKETQAALDLLVVDRGMILFHWAPTARRKQIIRHGLRPSMRPATHASDWVAPYLCFGDTPKWAWLLSGNQNGSPSGEWDLWQVFVQNLTEPHVLPSYGDNGIHEIRTAYRVFKRHLWLTATRIKPDPTVNRRSTT